MKIFYSKATGEFVLTGKLEDAKAFVRHYGDTPAARKVFTNDDGSFKFLEQLWTGLDDALDGIDGADAIFSASVGVEVVKV